MILIKYKSYGHKYLQTPLHMYKNVNVNLLAHTGKCICA